MKTCPNTPQNWQKAELAKNCSSNGCSEDEVYHCVQTETKGQLVEICTPAIFLQGLSNFIHFSFSTEYNSLKSLTTGTTRKTLS